MKIKTAELEGAALDWAVTKGAGALAPTGNVILIGRQLFITVGGEIGERVEFTPSTDPAQGWPLVENEPITSGPHLHLGWFAKSFGDATEWYGRTRLIASLRCYVASRLGDEVDVPDELG